MVNCMNKDLWLYAKNEAGGRMFSFATISNFVLNLENDLGTACLTLTSVSNQVFQPLFFRWL